MRSQEMISEASRAIVNAENVLAVYFHELERVSDIVTSLASSPDSGEVRELLHAHLQAIEIISRDGFYWYVDSAAKRRFASDTDYRTIKDLAALAHYVGNQKELIVQANQLLARARAALAKDGIIDTCSWLALATKSAFQKRPFIDDVKRICVKPPKPFGVQCLRFGKSDPLPAYEAALQPASRNGVKPPMGMNVLGVEELQAGLTKNAIAGIRAMGIVELRTIPYFDVTTQPMPLGIAKWSYVNDHGVRCEAWRIFDNLGRPRLVFDVRADRYFKDDFGPR